MENFKRLLPLNLQFFAEPNDHTHPPVDPKEPSDPNNGGEPEKRFSQADIDRIVKERLERERKKTEEALAKEREEAKRKELEEANEFKSLYEETKTELERLRTEAQTVTLEKAKTDLLVQAGYTGEQLDRVRKYLQGTDEASLKASLDEVKADIPPKSVGVDPSAGNTPNHPPKQKDPADTGRSLYQRLKEAGKIKR